MSVYALYMPYIRPRIHAPLPINPHAYTYILVTGVHQSQKTQTMFIYHKHYIVFVYTVYTVYTGFTYTFVGVESCCFPQHKHGQGIAQYAVYTRRMHTYTHTTQSLHRLPHTLYIYAFVDVGIAQYSVHTLVYSSMSY